MPAEKTLVYLILGAAGSGRREVIADLLDGGLAEGERTAVLLAEGEAPDPVDGRLGTIARWRFAGDRTIDVAVPAGADFVFLVTDGRQNPVDQIEAFKVWLAGQPVELARIVCVVNCRLAENNRPLLSWYDACIHFSDVVLLNRREGVANKWVSEFQDRLKHQFLPCLIEMMKGGSVGNPALILEPRALRISHAFDEDQDWVVAGGEGSELDDEPEAEGGEEVEMVPEEDLYFARHQSGRRVKEIPDIAKYLDRVP